MSTRLRAAVAVLALAGFYVVALLVLGGLALATVQAFRLGAGILGGKLGFVTIAAMAGVVVALWKVARAGPGTPRGPLLLRADAPELWAMVDEVAELTGTRAPDEIRLAPDVNAGVMEHARLLGLVGGTRHMELGVPLLQGLTVDQVRAVLAHEMGHYAHDDTRLSVVVHRGRVVIGQTLAQLSGTVPGWLLRQYGRFYLLVSAATDRRQELAADALMVAAVGRATAQSALRESDVVGHAWGFYLRSYVSIGWDAGLAPTADAFYGGFGQLLAARADELASLRTGPADEARSRWDSHPPTAARMLAMERLADVPHRPDGRPATVLVPQLRALAAHVADGYLAVEDRQRLPWDELVAAGLAIGQQRTADSVHRTAARLAGVPRATLGTVLDLVAQGRADEIARELGVDTDDPGPLAPGDPGPHPLADLLEAVLASALVAGGAARWRLDWAGPAVLCGREGDAIDLTAWARLAAVPAGVDPVRAWLAGLGVDVQAVGQVHDTATAHGAEVVAGLSNMTVDGAPHDVFVLDRGLVLLPCPKKTDGGRSRLIGILQSQPVHVLAAVHRYVPYEDVRVATVQRPFPLRATVDLHDGTRVELKERLAGEYLTKSSQTVLLGHLSSLTEVRHAHPAGT